MASSRSDAEDLTLNVWLDGDSVPIRIKPDCSVKDVKTQVAAQKHIATGNICLIFQGLEILDHYALRDLSLPNHTTIHAVQLRVNKPNPDVSASSSTATTTEDLTETNFLKPVSITAETSKSRFFVYCKTACKQLNEGKLRVRCHACKSSTFLLSRGPQDWSDVMTLRAVTGECRDCDGTYAEFYFKCSGHVSGGDDIAVPLEQVHHNLRNISCITCDETRDVVFVFSCEDRHTICIECFQQYCAVKLNDRSFIHDARLGYSVQCPAGCADSLVRDAHHFRLLGDQQYSRYQRFGAEECVLRAGGVLCPGAGCGAGILPDQHARRVTCQLHCQKVFCRLCLRDYHEGGCEELPTDPSAVVTRFLQKQHSCPCDVIVFQSELPVSAARALRARWDAASRAAVSALSRPCPQCCAPTQRSGGCSHMTCSRCARSWCWVCGGDWTRDCQEQHWFE